MLKIKKTLLNTILLILFGRKVHYSPFTQTDIKLQLIIKIKDKFVFLDNNLPSLSIDVAKKKSILQSVKYYLNKNISKKINNNSLINLALIDELRVVQDTKHEKRLISDNLYVVVDITDLCLETDMLPKAQILPLEDIKLLQFKNKINVYDYKVIIKSIKELGVPLT